jgi:predicted amidohydrolase
MTQLSLALVAVLSLASDGPTAPDGWRAVTPRDEIAPEFGVETTDGLTSPLLRIAGRGSEAVDGRWVRDWPVTPQTYYEFTGQYRAENVASPARSVLARVLWFDSHDRQVGPAEYPSTKRRPTAQGWTDVTGIYQAPAGAVRGHAELHLRWTPYGVVRWRGAELRATSPPRPRKVRLAAINHRPRRSSGPGENLERFSRLIAQAAERGADIVCLPEGITIVGTTSNYADVAEPIPGPGTERLAAAARAHKVYVVAGLYERDGAAVYNTSVLIGRDGGLEGRYRKVCLPREEIDGGITPGGDYPVFDTDFGRIGMMICWDLHFPEVARELAARGAEVILMPIWGGNDTLARARAIENQVYLVASGYDFKTTIYDQAGETLAESTDDPAVIVAEVDLAARRMWPWLGDWRARIWREGPARTVAKP